MGRPKLTKNEQKVKVSITLSKESNLKLEALTNNKSKFIENLIIKHKV
jgi:hypothetical protein